MKRTILALAALTALTVGTVATASAVEFGVGPDGVYGPTATTMTTVAAGP